MGFGVLYFSAFFGSGFLLELLIPESNMVKVPQESVGFRVRVWGFRSRALGLRV